MTRNDALAVAVDKRLPSYVQLRDTLAAKIARGDWKPDVVLPSENQLAAETGLSVGTVRKAMQMLVDEGLLERKQGTGTFLSKRAFHASLFRFFAVTTADGSPIIPKSRLIARARIAAPAKVARLLDAEDCIRIDRVRSHSDQVLLTEEIWIPHHRFPGLETLPEAEIGPLLYPLYLDRFQVFIANAVDEVSFARASGSVANRLGIAPDDPVAVIERTAFAADGTALEWRVAQGPAERFRYRSRLT
ncbi:GntR family transcriptional regulator [Falsirhodobacter halotolerans]|uniref:GntR family transcriptional regulator n=1 Tax=Falsirhodobacter halotolerans TaxID=1146892 RepID=UPI001FD31831|nr:GntR family transcriptional regulator [Falsirhodobacter halotolerans]MCJ8139546.1 GntR family transcriptional regulator [Falsirhodobacter halotolerans]